ncbi:hypothetical protein K788_0006546 [Paraburkholderia caribensis MBA4]|uniref:Uncharacterized protein n=1 Tax=Paraburkholderia caribensis MBA4 TaxID=1323664 RepID=A0A0P0R8E2_9BURK|nr:hypothetical protein K788_0006546 [Paraburkholderia caribensis MBA4]
MSRARFCLRPDATVTGAGPRAARRTAMLKQMRARSARRGLPAHAIETLNALTAYHLR